MQLKSSKACLNFARLAKLILVNGSMKQTTETILTLGRYIKGRGGGGGWRGGNRGLGSAALVAARFQPGI